MDAKIHPGLGCHQWKNVNLCCILENISHLPNLCTGYQQPRPTESKETIVLFRSSFRIVSLCLLLWLFWKALSRNVYSPTLQRRFCDDIYTEHKFYHSRCSSPLTTNRSLQSKTHREKFSFQQCVCPMHCFLFQANMSNLSISVADQTKGLSKTN